MIQRAALNSIRVRRLGISPVARAALVPCHGRLQIVEVDHSSGATQPPAAAFEGGSQPSAGARDRKSVV